jgi:type II secretory pathway component GspD/PulD (secretin)
MRGSRARSAATASTGGNIFGASSLNVASNLVQFNALGLPISAIGTTPPGAGLYQVLGSDYQATLRAIAQAGKTEVLSRPSILARNNQPATITVGQSVPLITNVRYDNFGNAINSVSYEDVGIILRVTPFISSNDGLVEMIVSPEISSLTDQTVAIANGVSVPVIAKRSADTVVVTPDGQTGHHRRHDAKQSHLQ